MRFLGVKAILLLIFFFFFVISIPANAYEVPSTINGNEVEWTLLFGNTIDPVSTIPPTGKRTKTPIILVHGNRSERELQGRWNVFLKHILKYDQFDVWIWLHNTDKAVGFNGNTGNASELAECLLNYIQPYYKSGTRPILVAHSRGGLVCRSYMNYDYNGDSKFEGENVLGLITLGTSHHGSPAAIPDWAAFSFSEGLFDIPPLVFNRIYGRYKIFDPFRIGDLNLAWDNMDEAIPNGLMRTEYNVDISTGGEMHLSPRDMSKDPTPEGPALV